jgi:hypothetical protein
VVVLQAVSLVGSEGSVAVGCSSSSEPGPGRERAVLSLKKQETLALKWLLEAAQKRKKKKNSIFQLV